MDNKKLTSALNVCLKYGFCSDCRQQYDSEECHRFDCYVNAVKPLKEVCEKESKYRWHNLRKNPDDLPVPDSGMEYIGVIVKVDNVREPFSVYYDCGEFTGAYDFVVDNVVAWRYIEPFEENES